MSRKELLIAGLLLAVAVVGGASIPRLLASPATSLGIALGPGPGHSVVQAPTIIKQPPVVRRHASSPVSGASAVSLAPVASATAQPTPTSGAAHPKHAASPPEAPAPVPTAPSPAPYPAQPPAATKRNPSSPTTPPGQAKTPPGQAKKSPGEETTPPGQAKTPPGQAKTPPGQAKAPPGHGPRAMHGRHDKPTVTPERQDLPGSGHGAPVPQQTPPHPVGSHHRRVGHLAPSSARPASPAPGGRPTARPEACEPRGKGGNRPATPPAPVTPPGHGQKGNGKGPRD
jgi:hypothetical protein